MQCFYAIKNMLAILLLGVCVAPLAISLVTFASEWMIYKKMGMEGWESLVPVYNFYSLCQALYGNGWKFLFILIPFYNFYFGIKVYFDVAKQFNKKAGFALGLIFVSSIFTWMLGLGSAQFRDGSLANTSEDLVVRVINAFKKKEN